MTTSLPLAALRVLDITDGAAEWCGRVLADLGAEVIRVEPPSGSPGRRDPIGFGLRNLNKFGVIADLDLKEGRDAVLRADVDIVLESFTHDQMTRRALTPKDWLAANPSLVVVSITDFGRTGPYRDRIATDEVLAAAGGVLSRSGVPDSDPVLPPHGLIAHTVGVHAAWAALLAVVNRSRTGCGEHVDVAALEAVVHGFDPGFGTQGSAAAGRADTFPRGRPDAANAYPIFRCADGHVRVCLLSPRQWRAMFSWLGEPAEFADARYDAIAARFAESSRLYPLIARLTATRTRDELQTEGSARGIPIAAVLSIDEVLTTPHFSANGALVDAEIAADVQVTVPTGYALIDGERAGIRRRAPQLGEHSHMLWAPPRPHTPFDLGLPPLPLGHPPLHGLRMLDLGVIVFGAELGRLFADQGADVIKIENSEFPDGLRQTRGSQLLNPSIAWGHRNKRSLGLNLRASAGIELFTDLARNADIVAANFKPGTLESLGISFADLARTNPRIVVADCSAFGARGPWRNRMGYGPLVRASCGLTSLWRDPAADAAGDEGFADAATVYPDHVAAHGAAVAVLASLIGRGAHGTGGAVEVAQADVALYALGPTLAWASMPHDSSTFQLSDSPAAGVYAAAGDDEWCVVAIRDHHDRRRLTALLAMEVDATDRGDLLAPIGAWLAARTAQEAEQVLQANGVPAAAMVRLPEELTDTHLFARDSFHLLRHPLLPEPLPTCPRAAHFSSIPDAPLRPAPQPGEHTEEIAASLLQLDPDEIQRLIGAGVLQPASRVDTASRSRPSDSRSRRDSQTFMAGKELT